MEWRWVVWKPPEAVPAVAEGKGGQEGGDWENEVEEEEGKAEEESQGEEEEERREEEQVEDEQKMEDGTRSERRAKGWPRGQSSHMETGT